MRESGGVFCAKSEQSVLLKAGGGDAFLCIGPVVITASIPIRDIAHGDINTKFIESVDDLGIRGAVVEHMVNEIAVGFG